MKTHVFEVKFVFCPRQRYVGKRRRRVACLNADVVSILSKFISGLSALKWKVNNAKKSVGSDAKLRRYANGQLLTLIQLINVGSWRTHRSENVDGTSLVHYVFRATICFRKQS